MKKAFTLIELLVVVLIIGILSAIALPQYQAAVDKARASELFALVKNIKVQQEVFYMANGHYAADCEELAAELPAGFEEDAENAGRYVWDRGSYFLTIRCKNGANPRVMGYYSSDTFSIGIEMFFDHIAEDVGNSTTADAGKSFCAASGSDVSRAARVCKSMSKEEKTPGHIWWL